MMRSSRIAPGGGWVSRWAMASAPPETSSAAKPAPTSTSPSTCLLTASSSTTRIGDSDATLHRAYHRAASREDPHLVEYCPQFSALAERASRYKLAFPVLMS